MKINDEFFQNWIFIFLAVLLQNNIQASTTMKIRAQDDETLVEREYNLVKSYITRLQLLIAGHVYWLAQTPRYRSQGSTSVT